ncbi:hypothetical protein [Bacillus sp. KH172YL63]|uniref:hypothetical protein n=1 Tax=Bacillus sp. KH172YL63 TaxID=2709784 RepID=UPI0013E4C9BD|nr:hypothetical protein [Bacillus sp. KH172YL63]BCB04059.1 hypothetical protein KH172YL63_21920 [Bacillus sp. KH172YL63]
MTTININFLNIFYLTTAIIIIYILIKWSKQLENRGYTVFIYFLISTHIGVVYSHSTEEGIFELWMPMGFIAVMIYYMFSSRKHSAKLKASALGLTVAMFLMALQYTG